MWIFQDFSATQILEINFGYFEAPKTAILNICVSPNFEFLTFPSVKFSKKSKLIASQIVKMTLFDHLN